MAKYVRGDVVALSNNTDETIVPVVGVVAYVGTSAFSSPGDIDDPLVEYFDEYLIRFADGSERRLFEDNIAYLLDSTHVESIITAYFSSLFMAQCDSQVDFGLSARIQVQCNQHNTKGLKIERVVGKGMYFESPITSDNLFKSHQVMVERAMEDARLEVPLLTAS